MYGYGDVLGKLLVIIKFLTCFIFLKSDDFLDVSSPSLSFVSIRRVYTDPVEAVLEGGNTE